MSRNTSTQTLNVNNVGTYDRALRLLLAVTMLSPAFLGGGAETLGWMTIPILASIYPVITGVVGWDPVYDRLNLSTVRRAPEPIDAAQVADDLLRRYHGTRLTARIDAHTGQAQASNSSGVSAAEKRAA